MIRCFMAAWIAMKLISLPLWLTTRHFPIVPVTDSLNIIPGWVHFILLICSLALMALTVFQPKQMIAGIVIGLEILSCVLDQNRWQPWEYQFIFFTLAYLMLKTENEISIGWKIVLTGTYFFGGFYKLTPEFIHDIWQYQVLNKWLHINTSNQWLLRLGYAIPLFEMLTGLLLYVPKWKRAAASLLVGMHLFILIWLGPVGLNMNPVVWPWNLALATALYVLFIYKPERSAEQQFHFKPGLLFLLLCWWVMPWFQRAGWDKYFSSVLYSGGVEQLMICTDNPVALSTASPYRIDGSGTIPCASVVPMLQWGLHDLNAPPCMEPRVFRKMIRWWTAHYGSTDFYLYKSGFSPVLKKWDDAKGGVWKRVR